VVLGRLISFLASYWNFNPCIPGFSVPTHLVGIRKTLRSPVTWFEMAFKIDFDTSTQIISVIFSGATDLDSKLRAVEEVTQTYADKEEIKILVDVREQIMDMSLGEQEAFGEYLANHYDLRKAKVAVLHEPSFNSNTVIDVISYKNGYQLVEFLSLAEATRWLIRSKGD